MHFIEDLLYLDPDASSGLFEFAVALLVASLLALGVRRALRKVDRNHS